MSSSSISAPDPGSLTMGLVSDKVRALLKQKRKLRSRLRRLESSRDSDPGEIAALRAKFQDMTGVLHELKADEATKAFVLFDKDRSGALSMGEFSALAQRLDPSLALDQIEAQYASMDLDDDARVSLAEFTKWWVAFAPDNVMRTKLKSALLKKYLHSKVSSDKQKTALDALRQTALDLRVRMRDVREGGVTPKAASIVRELFVDLRDDVFALLQEHAPAMATGDEPALDSYFPYFTGLYDTDHISARLQAARPEAIMRKLLQPGHEDPWLENVFFITHRRFLPSTLLLKLIVQRFFSYAVMSVTHGSDSSDSLPDTLVDPSNILPPFLSLPSFEDSDSGSPLASFPPSSSSSGPGGGATTAAAAALGGGPNSPPPTTPETVFPFATLKWSALSLPEAVRFQALLFLYKWMRVSFVDLVAARLPNVVRGFLDSVLSARSSSVSASSPSGKLASRLLELLPEFERRAQAAYQPVEYKVDILASVSPPLLLDPSFISVSGLDDASAAEWARQLTLLDFEAYNRIEPYEFLKHAERPFLTPFLDLFQTRSSWVSSEIMAPSLAEARARVLVKFINIAHCCVAMDNYASAMCILITLSSSLVSSLHATFAYLPLESRTRLHELSELINPTGAFSVYRSAMKRVSPPAVPFLLPYTTILIGTEASYQTHVGPSGELINVTKFGELASTISLALSFQGPAKYALLPHRGLRSYLSSYTPLTDSQLRDRLDVLKPKEVALSSSFPGSGDGGPADPNDVGAAAAASSSSSFFSSMVDALIPDAIKAPDIDPLVSKPDPHVETVYKPAYTPDRDGEVNLNGSSSSSSGGGGPGGSKKIPRPLRPLRTTIMSILDVHPLEIARQMCLLGHKSFSKLTAPDWTSTVVIDGRSRLLPASLPPRTVGAGAGGSLLGTDLVDFPDASSLGKMASSAMMAEFAHLQYIMAWTQSRLLLSSPTLIPPPVLIASSEALPATTLEVALVERLHIMCNLIDVAHGCFLLGNFAGMAAIVLALHTAPIRRLGLTWQALPPFFQHKLAALEDVVAPSASSRTHTLYAQAVSALADGGVVPMIPIHDIHLSRLYLTYRSVRGAEDAFSSHAATTKELAFLDACAAAPYRFHQVKEIVQYILHPDAGHLTQNEAMAAAIKLEPESFVPGPNSGVRMHGERRFDHLSQIRESGYTLSGFIYSSALSAMSSSSHAGAGGEGTSVTNSRMGEGAHTGYRG